MNFIKLMRESDSELLKAEARDLAKWSKLKHTRECLELFLEFNLAEISFKTKDGEDRTLLCTSNAALAKLLKMADPKPEARVKTATLRGAAIRSKDKSCVLTWDVENGKFASIWLDSWQIEDFIEISPDNVLLLDKLCRQILGGD